MAYHRIDVSVIQYNGNTSSTIFDMWNVDRIEISEKEFEEIDRSIVR